MADNTQALVFAFASYLVSLKEKNTYDASSLDATVSSLQETFKFSLTDVEDFKKISVFPSSAVDIYSAGVNSLDLLPYDASLAAAEANPKFAPFVDTVTKKGYYAGAEPNTLEYVQRHAKVILKFKQKVGTKTAAAVEEAAEKKKADGNTAMAAKKYDQAITCYTEALELSPEGPNSHIYLTNRAAAQCFLHKYEPAVADCESATAMCPEYVKAYTRLGLANFFMEKYDNAIKAYQSAVDLDPTNQTNQNALRQAIQKKEEQEGKAQAVSSSAGSPSSSGTMPGGGGMPDLSALAGMMGGAGGAGGLEAMMKNPAMMQAAQQMMQNPAMMQQAMQMMQGMGGGGAGGKPDMAAMAQMMQGMGGAPKR